MSVNIMLLPITLEFLADEKVKRWLGNCNNLSIPATIISARKPTLAEVQEIFGQLDGCTVESAFMGGVLTVTITKPPLFDGQHYGSEHTEIRLWRESCLNLNVDLFEEVEITVERESPEIFEMFVQKLANICGTYLVLGNGEPDYFVTPKNSAP